MVFGNVGGCFVCVGKGYDGGCFEFSFDVVGGECNGVLCLFGVYYDLMLY